MSLNIESQIEIIFGAENVVIRDGRRLVERTMESPEVAEFHWRECDFVGWVFVR